MSKKWKVQVRISKNIKWHSLLCHVQIVDIQSEERRSRDCYSCISFLVLDTGVGSLSLLQGIFPTQGSNPGLPQCRQILYQLSHKGSPRMLEWIAYPFSSGSSRPGNWTRVSCIAGRLFTNWAMRGSPQNAKFRLEFVKILSGTLPVSCPDYKYSVRRQTIQRVSLMRFCLSSSSLTPAYMSSSSPLFSALFFHETQSLPWAARPAWGKPHKDSCLPCSRRPSLGLGMRAWRVKNRTQIWNV